MITMDENKEKTITNQDSTQDVSSAPTSQSAYTSAKSSEEKTAQTPATSEGDSEKKTGAESEAVKNSQDEPATDTVSEDDSAVETEEDEALDDYQQLSNYKDVLFNDLVGDYDEFGTYNISEDVMQDLIDMPKKIDYIDESGIHARGFWGDHTFKFLVTTPIKTDNGDAYCYLKLDEQIDRMAGFQFDTQTSTIATYCYRFDELYDQFMRDVFHLREYESDDTGEEGRKYKADYLAKRYDLFYTMRSCSEDYYEKLEEIYFNHRLLMLGMDPELTVIMAEFNKKRLKLDPYLIISRRRFFFLNQLLDEILQMQAERLGKSEISARMDLLDAKYIEKSEEIKQRTLNQEKVKALLPKESEAQSSILNSLSKKPAPAQKKGVSKGGGNKPKSKPKKKGGKSGGKPKGKDKGKDKPKAVGKAGPSKNPTPQKPDMVIESFVETVREMGGGGLFGQMQM